MGKRVRPRCNNCKHRGDFFKLGELNHLHCKHPSEENMNPWDTLREFWSTCSKHEFNHILNTDFMKVSQQFEKYVAATKLAELESKGSGELNKFDHLAKDLYKEDFDEKAEKVAEWKARAWRSFFEVELTEAANSQYSEE